MSRPRIKLAYPKRLPLQCQQYQQNSQPQAKWVWTTVCQSKIN